MVAKASDSGEPFFGASSILEKLHAERARFDPTDAGQGNRDGVFPSRTFDLEREVGADCRGDFAPNRAARSGQIDQPALSGNVVPAKPYRVAQRHSVM